jgi:nitrous oxidase accessory protein NosD
MKKFNIVCVFLIFSFVFVAFSQISAVKTENTRPPATITPAIRINEDGSVQGTDAIQQDGNVYTLTGNITDALISISKDDIIFDGAGFAVQGTLSGIMLTGRNNVTVKNFVVSSNDTGNIKVTLCSNCAILNNTVNPYDVEYAPSGISVYYGESNIIAGNHIINNPIGIVLAENTHDNSIICNNITDNNIGIQIESENNTIYKNNFMNNKQDIRFISNSENPPPNRLDNGSTGNYWGNYTGTDNDGNQIGDTPHIIDESNQDNYPLMNPVDANTIQEASKIPEFPSWSFLVVGAIAVMALSLFYRLEVNQRNKK